jgi:hypothetical protein
MGNSKQSQFANTTSFRRGFRMSFSTGSRRSARIHNRLFNILQLLSNHLAERQTILKHSHKTFSSRAKKVVIRCGDGIVIAKESG